MDKMTVQKRLRASVNSHIKTLQKLEGDMIIERLDRLTEFKRTLDAELNGKYGDLIFDATTKVATAQDAYDTECERVALTGDGALYPLGTRLTKDTHPHHEKWKNKIVFGVVEAITRTSVIPDSLAVYSRPAIGSFVVRLLKVDGTPAKNFETSFHGWTPVDPAITKRKVPTIGEEIEL